MLAPSARQVEVVESPETGRAASAPEASDRRPNTGDVISVGATDNQDQLASFSDYGSTTVDLMAPGNEIFTDCPSYTGYPTAYASGTSYSAPMVAATAALLVFHVGGGEFTDRGHDAGSSWRSV